MCPCRSSFSLPVRPTRLRPTIGRVFCGRLIPHATLIRRPTIAICGALLLAACGNAEPPPIQETYAAKDFRPLGELYFLPEKMPVELRDAALVPDSKLVWSTQTVAKELGLGGVEVYVREQIVTLVGIVPTEEARQTLVERTKKLHGVSGVRDNLRVQP